MAPVFWLGASFLSGKKDTKKPQSTKTAWFSMSVPDIYSSLNTSGKGLSDKEAEKRKEKYGPNQIEDDSGVSAFRLFFSKFNSIIIYILLVAGIMSIYLGHMIEFYVIMGVIGFTVILGFIHEYHAEKSVEALAKLTAKKVELIRNGKKREEFASDLVPGDIVVLKGGTVVPADLRITESNSLSINESILTGESVPKMKTTKTMKDAKLEVSDQKNMAFSGTSVMSGSGYGVVVSTGLDTEIGKISEELASMKDQKTPLQKRVDNMSKRISYTVIVISIFALFYLLMQGEDPNTILVLVAALAVAGIPEQFPLSMTMALASGVNRMAKKNAIVKDMGSVETLGTTTVICTDKTGTLTQNKMMVVRYDLLDGDIDVDGKPYSPDATFKREGKRVPQSMLERDKDFFHTAILCNDSSTFKKRREWRIDGDPTEGALLGLANSAGFKEKDLREKMKRVYEVPFDSSRKYMITVNKEGSGYTAHLKGASERVLKKCTHIRKGGKIKKMTASDKRYIEKKMKEYSSDALRVLALAHKPLGKSGKESAFARDTKTGFIFTGIVGIMDPIRNEVIDSIKSCKSAGVRIIMITGDHKDTAFAIGRQLGLIDEKYNRVVEAQEIENMSDIELDKTISNIAIFSRATPDHKLRIVDSLQREGEIVAMTGDGVNDAPALKKADIGVSMGKSGTDVAREASNIVLADDAFSSIVEAVREGRTIYSNIRRFTYYLLTVNATEVGIIMIAILFGLATPLTALMILFINTVVSSFPALGLSVEPTKEKVMRYMPRDPKDKLLSKYLMLKISVVLPVMIFGALGLFLWEMNYGTGDLQRARTLAFLVVIMAELFHSLNARSLHISVFRHGMLKNKYYYTGMLVAIISIIISIYVPWMNMLLETVPVSPMDWLLVVGIGSLALLVTEMMKVIIKSEIEEEDKYQGIDLHLE